MREARDFADCIVASVPVPVVVLEIDCSIRQVNRSFCDLAQMGEREVLGRSFPDLVQWMWGVDGLREKLGALVATPSAPTLEIEHHSTTSDRRVLWLKAQPISTDGTRVILLTMEDITGQRHAEEEVAAQKTALEREIEHTSGTLTRAQRELRELAAHLFNVQEEERQRVARELHDDIAQRLTALSLNLTEARSQGASDTQSTSLEGISERIETLSKDVRHLSHRLHPAILDDLGLVQALKALVHEFEEREGMFATYLGSNIPDEVPRTAATAIYRVAQEALSNVAKHAGKTHVKVILAGREAWLRLEVRDFGMGFDQEEAAVCGGLGLISMKERARIAGGTFELRSELGQGTSLAIEVPLAEPA